MLDYNEYQRLLDIEQRFEKLSGQKDEPAVASYQDGKGIVQKRNSANDNNKGINKTLSSVMLTSQKKVVDPPILTALPSITYPPSATFELAKNEKREKKTNTHNVKKKKWYYLGVPAEKK